MNTPRKRKLDQAVEASKQFQAARDTGDLNISELLADFLAHAIKGESRDMLYLLRHEMQIAFNLGFNAGVKWRTEQESIE